MPQTPIYCAVPLSVKRRKLKKMEITADDRENYPL